MEALQNFIEHIDGFISGYILVFLLLGIGIYYTIRLGFLQISKFGPAMKIAFGGLFNKKEKEEGSLSSFQALATAIAAQVGTGNVGGVATAITLGGPGAVFWMWITAFLGMSTIFAEAVLAQVFRERRRGELVGGPAFYIKKGVGKKSPALANILAGSFAVLIVIALGVIGNMVQANSIADAVNNSFGIPKIAVGIAVAFFAGLIFIGGVQRIGRFAEMVVPTMAVLYILGAIILLFKFSAHVPEAFATIFKSAFTPIAAAGGFAGAMVKHAIKMGVQRGLFSNEAGMGSTPHAHAVANVKHPAEQGLTALVGVFIDTIVVCSATALSIIVTKSYEVEGLQGVRVTQNAFIEAFGPAGGGFLAICLTFFAFTTIVGWYYFGEANIRYLFGYKGLAPYRVIALVGIVFGSFQEVGVVWALSGLFNSLMVIPNIVGLLVLSPLVIKIYQDYNKQVAEGGQLQFDYDKYA